MKETQIAKENVRRYNLFSNDNTLLCCQEHLATCQRFLEFLDTWNINEIKKKEKIFDLDFFQGEEFNSKITDLQNAIKIYKDAGIK